MNTARTRRPLHIVHTEASQGWGGQELRILSESLGMMERGHRVTLLTPRGARIYTAAQERGIAVISLPFERKKLRGVIAMRRWLAANPIDLINSHSSTDSWLVALAQLGRRRVPVVRTRHISAPISNNAFTRWMYLRATNHVVTTGERLRRELIETNRFPPAHVTSVPTGMEPTQFTPGDKSKARTALALPTEARLIGIVATLRSWKGHQYLVEAFDRLDAPNTRLVIVGDGPGRTRIEDKIKAAGLTDRVILTGNQNDVLPWLQAMDVFALPSYANEGVPQALVQAMLCAKAIVTTDVGSILDAVTADQSALIVPARDSEQLANALRRLLDDAALSERLGNQARVVAVAGFSRATMLDSMEAIFARISTN